MRIAIVVVAAALAALPQAPARWDSIDGRVTQVVLPDGDITLYYVERKGGFTVELRMAGASIEGQKFYVGDGTVAVELVAHPTSGIFLQGQKLKQGDRIKKGSTIKVQPGYKKATDLAPGSIYVTLSNVHFELPGK